MRLKTCLSCGSSDLVTGGYLASKYRTRVSRDENPNAFLFRGPRSSEIFAVICADCGYVHPFASSPRELARTNPKGRTDLDISPSEGEPIRLRAPQS